MRTKIRGIRDWKTGYLRLTGRVFDELIYPAKCPVCGVSIPIELRLGHIYEEIADDADVYACEACRREFDFVEEPYCVKCGKQLLVNSSSGFCRDCGEKERSFICSRAVMNYDEMARELLSELKYRGRKENAYLFGLLAAERLGSWIKDNNIDLLVPVPVHAERQRLRGYNQAELIAGGIGRKLGIKVACGLVRRVKRTSAQKELGVEARLLNLENAFSADTKYIDRLKLLNHGRSPAVLVVDDIYTTGATMEAVSEALIGAGIDRVYGITIAAGRDSVVMDKAAALR